MHLSSPYVLHALPFYTSWSVHLSAWEEGLCSNIGLNTAYWYFSVVLLSPCSQVPSQYFVYATAATYPRSSILYNDRAVGQAPKTVTLSEGHKLRNSRLEKNVGRVELWVHGQQLTNRLPLEGLQHASLGNTDRDVTLSLVTAPLIRIRSDSFISTNPFSGVIPRISGPKLSINLLYTKGGLRE
jgi:hypothetical protein